MGLTINTNLMANNAARNLNDSYGQLAVSTRRLSSGLRVGTAADDAAGLAIRELMRADIASLNQGVRNANDAISMIQTADGALSVVDEKLIRMKELATQAATGTYNSDQRLIIDSEYQAMASEITRIANATDFNGIYLLNGSLEGPLHHGDQLNSTGQLKVHFGTANDSAEDYYYVQIGASTAAALGVGSGKNINFAIDRTSELAADFVEQWHYSRFGNAELARSVGQVAQQYTEVFFQEAVDETNHRSEISESDWNALSSLQQEDLRRTWGRRAASNLVSSGANGRSGTDSNEMYYNAGSPQGLEPFYSEMQNVDPNLSGSDPSGGIYYENLMNALARESSGPNFLQYSTPDGINISTQENAQRALDAINQAIVSKDKIRANLGAVQNRLENTVTNLSIQSENLMASESRISDVDVSSEMTEFIRNQILTQSATSMLAQANSLPRMAMQLIGG